MFEGLPLCIWIMIAMIHSCTQVDKKKLSILHDCNHFQKINFSKYAYRHRIWLTSEYLSFHTWTTTFCEMVLLRCHQKSEFSLYIYWPFTHRNFQLIQHVFVSNSMFALIQFQQTRFRVKLRNHLDSQMVVEWRFSILRFQTPFYSLTAE